jgi:aminoglycoside phosphotransferase (APT) family kinase protein
MANPRKYLPASVSEASILALLESLSLPIPTSITLLSTSAAYHIVYALSYSTSTGYSFLPNLPPNSSPAALILRIAGLHFPGIKTSNECAILEWLTAHTQISIPKVLHYDTTRNNELGYEYMLMSMVNGRSFEAIRKELLRPEYEDHLEGFLDQIVDIISELDSHSWNHIGGLQEITRNVEDRGRHEDANNRGLTIAGPVVDETMWQIPELDLFWGGKETFSSLNVTGPFPTYVSFVTAQAGKCIYAIEHHASLSPMLDLVPRIRAFMAAMDMHKEELNKTRLVLAHRDLHFGNIMYDVSTRRITAVLDWEFAGVVPAPRWDPQRAFLWNCTDNEEKAGLKERVVKKCQERGVTFFEDVKYRGKRQEHMQLAMNFLRAIVEVMPRGQVDKSVDGWREEMLRHMDAFCMD